MDGRQGFALTSEKPGGHRAHLSQRRLRMDYNRSWLRIEIVIDWKLFLSITLAAVIRHLLI
jgi:hypothetical protein